ncbi:GNAT family N-acetyltransferase [Psychrobacter sp. 16-MNA-CIBAN-0192]|uniref:GNAT family N-acetyltransferase n=1 Tax=Psychrobacter sp. 16-MNA-CIBAN-0192 TaxID=3140448 RepID=UPI0033309629
MSLQYALVGDMGWQQQALWQTPDTPFMTFAFWQALIDTGAIGEPAGWLPIFIMIYRADDNNVARFDEVAMIDNAQPIAVMPVFVKGHHRGEFVFDHAWAEAYARYGVDYYPRLVTSVPFTPITGERFWLAAGECLNAEIIKTAMAGIDNLAQQVDASSWHGLFVSSEFAALAASTDIELERAFKKLQSSSDDNTLSTADIPILERQGCQFLWQNKNIMENSQPFTDFEDFLATLRAKKRKTIRAERRKVAEQGIVCHRKCGNEITDDDWKTFYHCYVMTYAVRGQQPYLTADFFRTLAERMPQHLMLAQAYDGAGEIIASSLFLYDVPDEDKKSLSTTLYGRYWGALGEYDSLHFELCYYQGIEFAIEQGLSFFDPGTQGEHKLIRGFIPTTTHSLHRIYDARFIPAISDFCAQDRAHMAQYRQQAHAALPFNADNMPDFDSTL